MSRLATGALLGLVSGGGGALALLNAPPLRRPRLDARLAPYLRDTPRPSRLLAQDRTLTPFPTLERILRPVLADGVRVLDRWLGGAGSVRRRLVAAGRDQTVEQFRAEQLVWGAIALLAGLGLAVLLLARARLADPAPGAVSGRGNRRGARPRPVADPRGDAARATVDRGVPDDRRVARARGVRG